MLLTVILYLFVTCEASIHESDEDELVKYYSKFIEKRTEEALNFKLPCDARMYEANNKTSQDFGEFDFIIIGGGTAGCVLANRLSEIPEWNILLLEAGVYPDKEFTDIPSQGSLNTLSKYNWGFKSVPQKNACLGNVDKKCSVRRGKGIGGTTLLHAMVYSRGNPIDYQKWANLLNDSSWSYDEILKYFKKSENFTRTNFNVPIDESYHGYAGNVHITQTKPPQSISLDILKGTQQLGYKVVDYNGNQTMGGTIYQYFIKDGKRVDARNAYIAPVESRKNLKVLDRSYVTKIVISEENRKVNRVIFMRNNETFIARNKKDVILSAGVISSPQILMLSGIGPKGHLESVGINVIQQLPVGRILRDHGTTTIVFASNFSGSSESLEKSVRDFLKGRGLLTKPNIFDSALFASFSREDNEGYPDMEISFKNISRSTIARKANGWSKEIYDSLDVNVSNPFSINLSILHTRSVGTIELKSKDPFEYPLIDPNLLGDSEHKDIESHYQGIQLSLKLLGTQALSFLNASLAITNFPECNHTEPLSKEYWYCYLRRVVTIGHHQVATCLTGTSPETGVVDNQLRVFGIKGLRVADASVIPFPIRGHTNAITTVVGEKAADMIKDSYQK